MSENSQLELIKQALEAIKAHWTGFGLFHADFYSDESFGVNCVEKAPDGTFGQKHCFYSGYDIGDLLAYCEHVIEQPSEAYRDR